MVKRLARWMREHGFTHVVYRSAREIAIRDLLVAAAKGAGKNATEAIDEDMGGDSVVPAAVPEESAPG